VRVAQQRKIANRMSDCSGTRSVQGTTNSSIASCGLSFHLVALGRCWSVSRHVNGSCLGFVANQELPVSRCWNVIFVRALVAGYVEHYNNVRLNGAVGYITPKDLLTGRQQEIHAGRDRKLAEHGNGGRFAGRTAA
jgi:hypothetical protein